MRPRILIFSLAAMLAACAQTTTRSVATPAAEEPAQPAWRSIAKPEDATMLDGLDEIWSTGLAFATEHSPAKVKAEGAMIEPGAALDHPALPPGSYRCRVIRIGRYADKSGFKSFPPFFCHVKSAGPDQLTFLKQTGTDLPSGWLYPDGDKRYVFLGAQQDEPGDNSLAYGRDRSRDIAGFVERVGPFEWRLVVPHRDPDGLDIYALTPVPPNQQPD
ncbi:DUF4893 domain-containing protein [Stakelama marina]|uniref:DUF4893 domain-containing protein n=1 Tax=Stakelama marina TaxID=2826939 RepID=A0A8T4IIP7_9SPHN|nr:DUF4893 domain-containing protein [Stakelama marina]MBR0552066.1 DUF4893 domain-containing protein [Stakelama marina]